MSAHTHTHASTPTYEGLVRVALVADDDALIRSILRDCLRQENWSVVEAADGDRAIALATELRPRLILLDGRMPRRDGVDVARTLRRDIGMLDSYIMLLSARGRKDDIERAFAVGVDDYVTKPFDLDDVRMRIRRIGGDVGASGDAVDEPGDGR